MNPHQNSLTPLQRQHKYHKHQKGSPTQVKPHAEEDQIDEQKSKLHQHLPPRLHPSVVAIISAIIGRNR